MNKWKEMIEQLKEINVEYPLKIMQKCIDSMSTQKIQKGRRVYNLDCIYTGTEKWKSRGTNSKCIKDYTFSLIRMK